jgi:hypothetical protein
MLHRTPAAGSAAAERLSLLALFERRAAKATGSARSAIEAQIVHLRAGKIIVQAYFPCGTLHATVYCATRAEADAEFDALVAEGWSITREEVRV